MSQRSLVELNDDYMPGSRVDEQAWLEKMKSYYRSGDPKELPDGIICAYRKHHADKYPIHINETLNKLG